MDVSHFPPATWLRGRGCAPGTSSRPPNVARVRSVRARSGYVARRPNRHGPLRAFQGDLPCVAVRRLGGRRGSEKAAVAVTYSILVIAYHVLEREVPYEELGEDYFDRQRSGVREAVGPLLDRLGHKVALEPLPQSAQKAVARSDFRPAWSVLGTHKDMEKRFVALLSQGMVAHQPAAHEADVAVS